MPESPPELPAEQQRERPTSAFRAAWFGGMIEGIRGSDEELSQAVAKLNLLRLAWVELELDARRFSALIDERPLDASSWKTERLEDFVKGLQAVVLASAAPREVESNMRCVELYGDRAVETLFAVINGEVLCRSQERELRPLDEEYLARHSAPLELRRMGPLKKTLLGVGALLLTGALGWQLGIDNLLFPRAASELQQETGAFGNLLNMEAESVFGGYRITLTRGPGFPADEEGMLQRAKAQESLSAQAATLAVGTGDEVFVRVLSDEGKLLASSSVFLEGLLEGEQVELSLLLPAFRKAGSLELSTNRGSLGR